MDLIDEQDYLACAVHDFLHHTLEPFLELALVFRTGDEGTHIQGIYLPVLEVLRHLAVHYLLGYAFGYGGLANARLADQDRVVLGAAAQDLEDPSDFVVPAYDRVQLALRCQIIQIGGKA